MRFRVSEIIALNLQNEISNINIYNLYRQRTRYLFLAHILINTNYRHHIIDKYKIYDHTYNIQTDRIIACNENLVGRLPYRDLEFAFELFAPATVTFSACFSNFETILELYDETGVNLIASDNDGCRVSPFFPNFGQSELTSPDLQPGNYVLLLKSKEGPGIEGSYGIDVICDKTAPTARPTLAPINGTFQ